MKTEFIHIHNHAIAVIRRKASKGPLHVFLHGLGCSKRTYCYLLGDKRLMERSFLMIDWPGFGESKAGENFSFAMVDQARIVQSVIEQENAEEIVLIAHSMGGGIALLFEERFYQDVTAFANCEGNLIGADCGLYSRSIARMEYDFYRDRLFPKQLKDASQYPMLDLQMTSAAAMHGSARSLTAVSDSNRLLGKYQNLACRKMYFYGEENQGAEVLSHLPENETLMVPQSGHSMMFDNPQAFQQALFNFLD